MGPWVRPLWRLPPREERRRYRPPVRFCRMRIRARVIGGEGGGAVVAGVWGGALGEVLGELCREDG